MWWIWLGSISAHGQAPDRLTLGEGAVVVRAEASSERWAWIALDGSPQTVQVGIPRREPLPLSFVVELPAPTTFEHFEVPAFDTFGSSQGRHLSQLRIEGSNTSPDAGFEALVTLTLSEQRAQAPQRVAVPSPRAVRWLRVTATERFAPPKADTDPHQFSELSGFGPQQPVAVPEGGFSGRWRLRRKGLNDEPGTNVLELHQDGQLLRGCYSLGGQQLVLTGSVEAGLARLMATNALGQATPMTARLTSAGELAGVRFGGPAMPFWMAPAKDAAVSCAPPPEHNPVDQSLRAGQVAVLHGIHFDVDADVLRADARPALEQLLDALQRAPERRVRIEGHTDSDGPDAHNLTLSDRRAAAVVAWLVKRGVAAERLDASGVGEARPIADNGTAAGRALNRRVEVHPVE